MTGTGKGKDGGGTRRCPLCGCRDHRLFGCFRHVSGSCSCRSRGG